MKNLFSKFRNKHKDVFQINSAPNSHINKANPNSHIVDYLKYYLTIKHSPYFAVLISGAWGIGKTHLVKAILKDFMGDEPYSYVSLYGLSSFDEIDAALYQTFYPILASTGAKILGRAGKIAMKYGRVDGAIKMGDFTSPDKSRLYVFDDIERCSIKPSLILGYINELVEHDGCKVVIIANESRLLEIQEYKETREKLIGKTLEVQPEADSALRYFLGQVISIDAKKIMEDNSNIISKTFKEASVKNFRILQQTIWDFERVIDHLEGNHLKNSAGIKSLLSLFFAISIEAKAGNISLTDISSRPSFFTRAMQQAGDKSISQPLDSIQKQFSSTDIYDTILNNQVLVDILFKGIIHQDQLRDSLNQSTHFIDKKSEAAWRTVWHALERDESDFNVAYAEMERQFREREILEIGLILHVVGLRLWISDVGILNLTREEVIEEAKIYIDDLYSRKLLQYNLKFNSDDDFFFQGYGGLGIHQLETTELRNFIEYLKYKKTQAAEDSYPERAEQLLNEMESDTELFYRRICWTNDEENIYATIPLLAVIPPKTFVERAINLKGDNRRKVIAALNARYVHGSLLQQLAAEKDWLDAVRTEFYLALELLTPIGRWGISGALRYYLDPLVIEPNGSHRESEA